MRIKNTLFIAGLLAGVAMLASCTTTTVLTGGSGYDNVSTVGSLLSRGQFRVQLVECVGNAGSQSVTAVLAVTNRGPNTHCYIGGSVNKSVAIDDWGYTSKPYNSVGTHYDLPSDVVVRVEVPRIEPVRPGTPKFQILRINIGSGESSLATFRNVPITWSN